MKPESDAPPIFAAPEEEEGEHAKHRADQRDEVGRKARARRPARQVEGRLAPKIERQGVGHALVGGVIGGALDRLRVAGIERQHERALALPQLVVAELAQSPRRAPRSRSIGSPVPSACATRRGILARREHAPSPACRRASAPSAAARASPSARPDPSHKPCSRAAPRGPAAARRRIRTRHWSQAGTRARAHPSRTGAPDCRRRGRTGWAHRSPLARA